MKKKIILTSLLSAALIATLFLFWGSGDPRMKNFPELKKDYERIVKVVWEYHTDMDNKEEFVTIYILDGDQGIYSVKCDEQDIILTDEERESLANICTQSYSKYNYIWVSSEYVIFWEDEMKKYGILYANKPEDAIKDIKTWYEDLEYHKLDKCWYEIGYFGL